MSIICLFSVDNNYDQPMNNLVGWWSSQPTVAGVALAIKCSNEDAAIILMNIGKWPQEDCVGHRVGDIDYRIQWVEEGVLS